MRILIVNTVALNAGDAAILQGEVRALREAYGGRVEITVADDDAIAARRWYADLELVQGFHEARRPGLSRADLLARSTRRRSRALALSLLPRGVLLARELLDPAARDQLDRIAAADVVVATGGTYLVEHYPLAPRLRELRVAQALGRPTYLYTQSMGPFQRPRIRRLVAPVLRRARHVFLRDGPSREHAMDVGVSGERASVHPDAAFVLAPPAGPRHERPGNEKLRVAVSVRSWRRFRGRSPMEGERVYRESVAEAVRLLHARGADITFLSTCQGVDDYWTDDARFARGLVNAHLAGLGDVRVDGAFRRPEELVEHLRAFDFVIATRMHFAILALCAGVPVLPIAYEFKTTELFAGLGMGELVEDIETITADRLCVRMCDALDRLPSLGERIRSALPGLRERAAEPARRIQAAHPARPEGGP